MGEGGGVKENLMYYCLKNVSNYLVASLLEKTYFATANKFGFFKDKHAIDAQSMCVAHFAAL